MKNYKPNMELIDISPTQFENLIFDIMIAKGMCNVAWRTPGADGGRDIEGIVFSADFSLSETSAKWYVECKRYTGSVDWPTIYNKISYADVQNADVLLMCTSSKFTPAAISNVEKWNADKKRPLLRLWPGHQISLILEQNPDIAMKYGLLTLPEIPTGSVLQLTLALSKAVGTHFSKIIFLDERPTPMLEAAHYIAQLLQKRMEDVSSENRFKPVFLGSKKQILLNCTMQDGCYNIDEPALSAFIAYLSALARKSISVSLININSCLIYSDEDVMRITHRYKSVFDAIAIWGDFEYMADDNGVLVRQRT